MTANTDKVKGIPIPVTTLPKEGQTLVAKLQAANKVAGAAREELMKWAMNNLEYAPGKPLKDFPVPAGKALKGSARYGNLWFGLVDAKKSAAPKQSLQEWLAEQAA